MGSIDKLDWHSGGDFPKDIPEENGATHIGMYVAWILHKGLYGDIHKETAQDSVMVNKVLNREITGREYFISQCDAKFTDGQRKREAWASASIR